MATFIDYAARLTVPPAGNADLNPTPDAAIDIMFSSYDPSQLTTTLDGNGHPIPNTALPPSGDLVLEDNPVVGVEDPNTYISIDGGLSWSKFDVLFWGVVNPNNTGNYDKTSDGGPNFNNYTLVSVRLTDGTELFFYPSESFTLVDMDLFPNGGVGMNYAFQDPFVPPPICFVNGTLIATSNTEVAVEDLKIGDVVITRDNGPQTVSWLGKKVLSSNTPEYLLPIRIKANALGEGLPKRDLLVSPQHRILLTDWRADLLFGTSEVLVAAKHLVNDNDIRVATDMKNFEYFHILFDTHQTIFSEGLPTESFHPGDMAMRSLSEESRAEVLELFPQLADDVANYGPSTHTSIKAFEAKALQSV